MPVPDSNGFIAYDLQGRPGIDGKRGQPGQDVRNI